MNTTTQVNEKLLTTIVAFHIGRGGRYHNAGHLSYAYEHSISYFIDDLFEDFENRVDVEEKIGDRENLKSLLDEALDNSVLAYNRLKLYGLDLGQEGYSNSNGDFIISQEDVDSGIGCVNNDNDYDTTYTKFFNDCTEKELQCIIDADFGRNIVDAAKIMIENI